MSRTTDAQEAVDQQCPLAHACQTCARTVRLVGGDAAFVVAHAELHVA